MQNEKDKSQDAFIRKTKAILENIIAYKMNTVFFHARAFSDAFYKSSLFPTSAYLSGTQGEDVGYDPLELFCREAGSYGVQVHAWINPFRICADETKWDNVCDRNPAKRFLTDEDTDNDTAVVFVAGGVYYDPASPAVQSLILQGVRELLQNYPLAGIHIDDYFYPAKDEHIDHREFMQYKENGGTMSPDDWRRETVSAWVHQMYRTVKSFGTDKIFSISPAVNITSNYENLYADVRRWCREPDYCDWIIPQLYVGFAHETMPFDKAAAHWNDLIGNNHVRLLYGLAAYKCGQTDAYAGTGRNEWTENENILSRQIVCGREFSHCDGFSFFSYSSLFGENAGEKVKKELQFVTFVL